MGRLEVRGVSVGYDDIGGRGSGGVPLVLVHGHPFDRTMWRPQTHAFPGQRVIAPDLRGYGATTVVPGVTPLDAFAHDLAALLDRLGVARATLCGLSMGGQIVLEFHRLFPERVAGLVLADTFAQADTPQGRKERNDRADTLLRDGMAGYAHAVLDSMVAPATVRDLPEVAAHVLDMMLAAPPRAPPRPARTGRTTRLHPHARRNHRTDPGRRRPRRHLHPGRRRALPVRADPRRPARRDRGRGPPPQPGTPGRLQPGAGRSAGRGERRLSARKSPGKPRKAAQTPGNGPRLTRSAGPAGASPAGRTPAAPG